MTQTGTALRICPLCEATCGLTPTIDNGRVTGARGDREDVFSHGFICPKGATTAELDNDPDRLARPMVRRDGVLTEATWDEAYAVIAERLGEVVRDHGGTSVGVYLGNPNAHTIAGSLYAPLIVRALGTRHVYNRKHPRPDAETRRAGPHVRQSRRLHRARPRPHRLSRDHRRESLGGNMTAALAILAKQRGDVAFVHQSMYYPGHRRRAGHRQLPEFAQGPFLTAKSMAWFWDAYLPDHSARAEITASPLRASAEQLGGLPEAFVIVDENDVLRDEGEAYARKLIGAGVRTTCVRYNGILHDFMMLNPMRQTAAATGAIEQAIHVLRKALGAD